MELLNIYELVIVDKEQKGRRTSFLIAGKSKSDAKAKGKEMFQPHRFTINKVNLILDIQKLSK